MLVYIEVVNKNCEDMKESRIINTDYVVQIRAFGGEASNGAINVGEETCFVHLYDSCQNGKPLRVYGNAKDIANFISRGEEGLKPKSSD